MAGLVDSQRLDSSPGNRARYAEVAVSSLAVEIASTHYAYPWRDGMIKHQDGIPPAVTHLSITGPDVEQLYADRYERITTKPNLLLLESVYQIRTSYGLLLSSYKLCDSSLQGSKTCDKNRWPANQAAFRG